MKINIIKAGILLISAAVLGACDNAGYQEVENGIFISEAAPSTTFNKQIENLTVKGDVSTAIHVRLAQPLDKDVHVKLGLAESFVAEYNATYGANYEILSEEYLSFDRETVIPAGSLSSDAVNINIKRYPTGDGIAYCVPVCIEIGRASCRERV